MINLVGEHRAKDRVRQMIVAVVPSEVGVQVLNRVIHMLLCGDFFVVPFPLCLAILFSAVLCDLGCGKHSMRR